ncbi:MAG: hypothetical protein QF659_03600 [Dehalococcoidia bacterium]|jgi:hypothetical protein|nr:hypothetical protein [Dehalococcoidia bacterium]
MLKLLLKGLFGRLLGYAVFALGFWLLFQGFSRPNAGLAILGGGMVLGSIYLMVAARRSSLAPRIAEPAGTEEDDSGDSLDGSGQGGQLPP